MQQSEKTAKGNYVVKGNENRRTTKSASRRENGSEEKLENENPKNKKTKQWKR